MLNITYSQVGDYLLPNIVLGEPPDADHLTRYGMMRKSFLKQHRSISYNRLLLSEKLFSHCREVQQSAESRLEIMMEQLMRRDPPPNKTDCGLAWAAHMTMLRLIAEESILAKLVYDDAHV